MQIRHSPEKLLDVILMPAVFLVLFLYVFGGQPKLRQPSDRGRGERGVRDIGQCRAAPSAQRLGQQRRGFRAAPVAQRPSASARRPAPTCCSKARASTPSEPTMSR